MTTLDFAAVTRNLIRLTAYDGGCGAYIAPAAIFAIEPCAMGGHTLVRHAAPDGSPICSHVTETADEVHAIRAKALDHLPAAFPQVGDSKCWLSGDGKPYKVIVESLADDGHIWVVHTRTNAPKRTAWTLVDWQERSTAVVWASDPLLDALRARDTAVPSTAAPSTPRRWNPLADPRRNDTKRWTDSERRVREVRVNHVSVQDGAVVLAVQPTVGRQDGEATAMLWNLDDWRAEHSGVTWSRGVPDGMNDADTRDPRMDPEPDDVKSWGSGADVNRVRVASVTRDTDGDGTAQLTVSSDTEGLAGHMSFWVWLQPECDVAWTVGASPRRAADTAPLLNVIHDEIEVALLTPIRTLAECLRAGGLATLSVGDAAKLEPRNPCTDPRPDDVKRWKHDGDAVEATVISIDNSGKPGGSLMMLVRSAGKRYPEAWSMAQWQEAGGVYAGYAHGATWSCGGEPAPVRQGLRKFEAHVSDDGGAPDDDGTDIDIDAHADMDVESFALSVLAGHFNPDDGTAVFLLPDGSEQPYPWGKCIVAPPGATIRWYGK